MAYAWLDEYLTAKPGMVKEYKEEWEAFRYLIGGKQYAMICEDKSKVQIITLKLLPADNELLRSQHNDVFPGYYSSKLHWSSVYLEGNTPDDVLRWMIDESYRLVLASLTKKVREAALS